MDQKRKQHGGTSSQGPKGGSQHSQPDMSRGSQQQQSGTSRGSQQGGSLHESGRDSQSRSEGGSSNQR